MSQSGKVAETDYLCPQIVFAFQLVQRLIDQEYFLVSRILGDIDLVQTQLLLTGTMLHPLFAPSIVDEDVPHGFGGGREEMRLTVPILAVRTNQLQVGFMDKSRRLQSLAGRLLRQASGGQFAELAIDKRQ